MHYQVISSFNISEKKQKQKTNQDGIKQCIFSHNNWWGGAFTNTCGGAIMQIKKLSQKFSRPYLDLKNQLPSPFAIKIMGKGVKHIENHVNYFFGQIPPYEGHGKLLRAPSNKCL